MPWTRLQFCTGFTLVSATMTATFTSNLTPNSKIIIGIMKETSGTASINDGNGNNFIKVADTGIAPGGFGGAELWLLDTPAVDAGTKPTITATLAGGDVESSMIVQEVAGLVPGVVSLDGKPGTLVNNNTQTGGTVAIGSPAYSSTAKGEYLISVCAAEDNDGNNNMSLTPPTGGVDAIGPTIITTTSIRYTNSTGGAESGSWTLNVASSSTYNGWGVILAAFQCLPPAPLPSLPNTPALITSNAGWRNAGHSR